MATFDDRDKTAGKEKPLACEHCGQGGKKWCDHQLFVSSVQTISVLWEKMSDGCMVQT